MALTDTFLRSLKADAKPRKYSDGGGLFIYVPVNGSRLWRMAYGFANKQRTLSFGAYTKSEVVAAIAAKFADFVGNAPEAIDTVYELAAALGDDPNFATTITTLIGQKLAKDQNLNDLPDKATARANLGADAAYLGKTAKAADSAKLNGQAASYYTDIAARLGFTPADSAALAALITNLASTANGKGAATVGMKAIAALAGVTNVQAALEALAAKGGFPNAVIEDQKASGTDGGTFTKDVWQTRDLNTEVRDPAGLITLSANQFTPSVDGYVAFSAGAYQTSTHQVRLYNVTDSAVVAGSYGTSETAGGSNFTVTRSFGECAVAEGKTYRLEHRCAVTVANNGFGKANSFGGPEVYSRVRFWRT